MKQLHSIYSKHKSNKKLFCSPILSPTMSQNAAMSMKHELHVVVVWQPAGNKYFFHLPPGRLADYLWVSLDLCWFLLAQVQGKLGGCPVAMADRIQWKSLLLDPPNLHTFSSLPLPMTPPPRTRARLSALAPSRTCGRRDLLLPFMIQQQWFLHYCRAFYTSRMLSLLL